jgi:ssDNA-binding Zn-finger/Zn-ribbon topoisomerase 1
VYCDNCGKKASQKGIYCAKCGKPLGVARSASGDSSANIVGSNKISNSTFHIGDVYEVGDVSKGVSQDEKMDIARTYVKPISVVGHPVKTSWVIVSGAVGFIGSFASIFSVLGSSSQFFFIVSLAISMIVLMNGVMLWKTKFSRFIWFNLESKDSQVYVTKLGGECPKCDGVLKLANVKISENHYKTYTRCSRNRDHKWDFDPTKLDSL